MERLTSNKPTSDMNMLELAYNSCYADEKCNARYRDYELDIDSRELIKNLAKDMCDEDLSNMSDEEFDEYMAEMLSVEVDSQIGLLALFYRNLWAMADLREKLKEYEDLEEQGRLIKLPLLNSEVEQRECVHTKATCHHKEYKCSECPLTELFCDEFYKAIDSCYTEAYASGCLAGIELGKSEAEAKLKELRGAENE
jgi:hypothetical protein